MSYVFFPPCGQKNRIYTSDYPASARTKFVCPVKMYASGTYDNFLIPILPNDFTTIMSCNK